jgi:ABC-type branched-subunit amino acid transport system substrate-binding protein
VSYAATGAMLPIVSYGVSTIEFSDPSLHPYFSRTIVSDITTAQAFLSIMRQNGWKKAIILHTTNTYGRGLTDWVSSQVPSDWSIIPYGFPSKSDTGESDAYIQAVVERIIQQIRDQSDIYIMLLHAAPLDVLPSNYSTTICYSLFFFV